MKTTLLSLAALVLCAGCSSASGSSGSGSFPISVMSDSKSLHVELAASPPPVVGTNTVELTVTRVNDGAPQDGLDVAVVPWMPAMDHGTSSPTVTPEGGGKYRVTELYLFMPGTWVLKTSFSGSVSDHAEPEFEIQ
jgi:YtkA-like